MKKLSIILLIATLIIAIMPLSLATVESFGTFKKGTAISLIQTYNSTYCNISSILSPTSFLLQSEKIMTKNVNRFNYTLPASNTSLTGTYVVCGYCDGAVWCADFEVTPNGEESDIGSAILYIGLLAVLIFFLTMSIMAFKNFDNLLTRVGMLGISYLLIMAITFIGWNMANDFLTSAPFLVEMLRILFFVLIVGLFPLLIGAFAWYVIMLFKIKEIQRLMDHGMDMGDAERRVGRRHR